MAIKFNPLSITGLDFLGTGGGGGTSGPAERYIQTFNNTTDWVLSSPDYTLTITAATYGKGINPNIQIFELIASNYEQVTTNITINNVGDITIKISESPDNRFPGLILVI